ncbi:hypothetical protein [Lysobacter gummosus]|uniref:hypothetical protein n=1 Tax=Lysobacter gummosus TaxID=262324 RepID=UPI00363D5826
MPVRHWRGSRHEPIARGSDPDGSPCPVRSRALPPLCGAVPVFEKRLRLMNKHNNRIVLCSPQNHACKGHTSWWT